MSNGYKNGKPDVDWWLTQLYEGIQYRRKCASEDRWPIWRAYYRGNWKANTLPSNVFFKMLRSIVPRIYFRDPSISVITKNYGYENLVFAQILEKVDNSLIRSMGIKGELKMMVQDAFMFGTGVGKLGFGAKYTMTPDIVGDTVAPNSKGKAQQRIEYDQDIMANMPWFKRIHPRHYIVPAGCSDPATRRWSATMHFRSIDDIKDDRRFKNTKDLKPGTNIFGVEDMRSKIIKSVDEGVLFEIRDKKTGMVFIISPFLTTKVLYMERDEFLSQGSMPDYPLIFNPDDEYMWGIPDSKILEPQQKELNEIRTLTMKHRRIAINKIIAEIGSISSDEAQKLVSEDVSPIIWAKKATGISPLQATQIPQDLFFSENQVMDDVRETLGFSRNEFGEFEGGSRKPSAYETRVVKAASDLRVDERRDILADMLVNVVEDMHRIIFNHWNTEQVVEVVGPAGIPFWVRFRGDMLKRSQYQVSIDPDTSIAQTKEMREQKALVMYERLKTNPLIDPYKLTTYLLHEMYGVAFDDMMRGLPRPNMGMTPNNPLDVQQYAGVLQQFGQRAPQLAAGGGAPRG